MFDMPVIFSGMWSNLTLKLARIWWLGVVVKVIDQGDLLCKAGQPGSHW